MVTCMSQRELPLKISHVVQFNVIGYDQSMHKLITPEAIHIIYRSLKIGISEEQPPLCIPVSFAYSAKSHTCILDMINICNKYKTT